MTEAKALSLILATLFLLAFGSELHAEQNPNFVWVEYSSKPTHFSWSVNGKNIGIDRKKVIAAIQATHAKDVYFRSQYKLTNEAISEIRSLFSESHVIVREFWVPVSDWSAEYPYGWVDLTSTFR